MANNRYEPARIRKNKSGSRYFTTTFYPSIPYSLNDIYVITGEGDRLDLLANQYYKDSSLWWIILSANPLIPKDSLFIPVGTQLRIPVNVQNILANYSSFNTL